MDFPGLRRVDAQNGSDVSDAIAFALKHYKIIIEAKDTLSTSGTNSGPPNFKKDADTVVSHDRFANVRWDPVAAIEQGKGLARFQAHIMSLGERAMNVVDVISRSASIHFVRLSVSVYEF